LFCGFYLYASAEEICTSGLLKKKVKEEKKGAALEKATAPARKVYWLFVAVPPMDM
jgi:hypothetical protein